VPKTAKSAEPTITRALTPDRTTCPHCGGPIRADYANRRTVHTLAGVTRLNLTIRRCRSAGCVAYKKPYRPEAEGAVALPRHEFGLDVIALIGRLRYAEHRSVPEIRTHLVGRGVTVSERAVTNLLDRYDELKPKLGEGWIVIFDRTAPSTPPERGATLILGAPGPGAVEKPAIVDWDREAPPNHRVDYAGLLLRKSRILRGEPLLRALEGPVATWSARRSSGAKSAKPT